MHYPNGYNILKNYYFSSFTFTFQKNIVPLWRKPFMNMKKTIYFLLLISFISCAHRPAQITSKTGEIILIDSSFDAIQDSAYIAHLAPTKAHLEQQLGAPIGHAPRDLEVYQPECPMLNWASDALLSKARELCPNSVDAAVVNIGGMRCNWGAGDITFRHVFELMPFDNELVVLTMPGKELLALCQFFAKGGGEGIAGMTMKAEKGQLQYAKVNGQDIQPDTLYTVATSDYLSQGNDGMIPLKNHIAVWKSERKIRDLYIEYIQQVQTVEAQVDGRMQITK